MMMPWIAARMQDQSPVWCISPGARSALSISGDSSSPKHFGPQVGEIPGYETDVRAKKFGKNATRCTRRRYV